MSNRLKIQNILIEADGGGAVHASGPDLASFITKNGTIDWLNLVPDQTFGKKKINRRGVDVSNTKDGGVAHAIAQAMFSADQAESQLQDLGVRVSDLDDQDTIDYYKALKNFQLVISLESPIDELFGGQKDNIEGLAYVDKRSNAKKFIMYFKHNSIIYKMDFSPETLQKNLKGTSFDLPMLIKNGIYEVKISISDSEGSDSESDSESGDKSGDESGDEIVDNPGENQNPPTPPSIKGNRNEIFRQLLKNYGGFDGGEVFGDGFLSKEEAKEYVKLQKSGDKSAVKNFIEKSSRNKYSNMVSNLRKSFPNTFFGRLKKAFPEFNINFSKTIGESSENSFLIEQGDLDKYKRWRIVFGSSIKNDTIDKLDENIRGFMAAVKKWFKEPINYRGKTQSYDIDFDGDKVNDYWNNFYGKSTKKESLKIGSILGDLITEKRFKQKTKPPRGSQVGKGDSFEDDDATSEEYEVRLKINDIPTFGDENISKSGGDEQILFMGRLKITDGGGNSTWSISGAEDKVNMELKKGVIIRKSMKFDKFLIVEWRNPIDLGGKPTKAMLIAPNMDLGQFLSKVGGTGVSDVDVEIGKKVGGDESIENPAKGKITLKLKS